VVFTARCTTVQSAVFPLHVDHVVCLSVCPSVTLVDHDHICWKSWKVITRPISPTPSLFVALRPSTYSQGNMGNFWETRGGWKKWRSGAQKRQYLKNVKIEEKLLWRPIGSHQRSFERYHSRTLRPLFPDWTFATPAQKSSRHFSGTGKATDFKYGQCISGSRQTQAN